MLVGSAVSVGVLVDVAEGVAVGVLVGSAVSVGVLVEVAVGVVVGVALAPVVSKITSTQ